VRKSLKKAKEPTIQYIPTDSKQYYIIALHLSNTPVNALNSPSYSKDEDIALLSVGILYY